MGRLDELIEVLKEHVEGHDGGYTPLYHRIQRAIRFVIEDGRLGDDDALPPERDLAQALGVSRVTVRNAIRGLVGEGLLVQRHGAGTFVSRRIEMTLKAPTSFSEDMWARGMEPEYKMLDRHTGPSMPVEADMLELRPGAQVTRLYRVRYANKKPMCLELTCVPSEILPEGADIGKSLYSHLTEMDMRPVRAMQRLRAELLDMEQARLLGVAPGSAGLFIEQQSFLSDGRPIEYVRSHYRGDSYDFVAELKM
ncbi:MAG TPA: GntR family transcriptional regulator [Devosiaceae bacterium]